MNVLFLLNESVMFERLGVMYLIAALKQAGHTPHLAYADSLGSDGLERLMREFQPGIVAYSVMTGEHHNALAVNRRLKEKFKFLSVFGGPHPTFFPELISEEGVDAVCIGEGDLAFPEFVRRVEAGEPYWRVGNFRVKHEGTIVENELSDLVGNLDTLPDPDRDLMYRADPSLRKAGPKLFSLSRGCPYQCTYCFNHKYNQMYKGKGAVLRHRSPERIIAEIVQVMRNYPMEYAYFSDDTFLLKPPGWMETFCKLYKEKVARPMFCSIRANVVTDELIGMLREAGLCGVWMGVECGNDAVANEVLHRNMDREVLRRAAQIVKRHGIRLCTQNIVGLPVENAYEIDKETLDFNIELKPDHPIASILYPYPRTWIEAYAREKNFLPLDAAFPETNKRTSMLVFRDPKEKRKIQNLHKLFAFFVWMPSLRKHCDFLCRLPLESLYLWLFYFSYGWGFKVKMSRLRSFRKDILNYMGLFFRMIRKS